MPLNPANAEVAKKEFAKRAGVESWDSFTLSAEDRVKTLASLRSALDGLAKSYKHTDGVFLDGHEATYADLIVGAWLQMFRICCKEWEEIRGWHDGLWGALHDALEPYAAVN